MTRVSRLAPVLALTCLVAFAIPPLAAQTQPNILVIVLDDVGIEHLSFYGIGREGFANTDALEDWDGWWLQFNDAWSSTECSPTRATIHTGLYPNRTGVGRVINCDGSRQMDVESPDLLPRLLAEDGYATGAFGKWHLGTDPASFASECDGLDAPIVAGYDRFDGIILDIQTGQNPYFSYTETHLEAPVDCTESPNQEAAAYQTYEIAGWAANWITDQLAAGTPYFAWVAFTAAHAPFHCPPQNLYDVDFVCDDQPGSTDSVLYRDMIAALAEDIDRVLSAAAGIDPDAAPVNPADTLVVIVGDNGSPSEVAADPVAGSRAKSTVFQGGVRVPMLMLGDVVTPGLAPVGEMIGAVDLYATALRTADDLYELPSGIDSVPMNAYFVDPQADVRDYLYTEWFYPNFDPDPMSGEGPSQGQQAVRDRQYKYVTTVFGQSAMFDLLADPWEADDLLPIDPWRGDLIAKLAELDAVMDTIVPGGLAGICQKQPAGQPCTQNSDCCSRTCNTALLKCINPIPEPSCPPS